MPKQTSSAGRVSYPTSSSMITYHTRCLPSFVPEVLGETGMTGRFAEAAGFGVGTLREVMKCRAYGMSPWDSRCCMRAGGQHAMRRQKHMITWQCALGCVQQLDAFQSTTVLSAISWDLPRTCFPHAGDYVVHVAGIAFQCQAPPAEQCMPSTATC